MDLSYTLLVTSIAIVYMIGLKLWLTGQTTLAVVLGCVIGCLAMIIMNIRDYQNSNEIKHNNIKSNKW